MRENAVAAAFRDPRFPPLAAEELDEVRIEVSVLSPPEPLVVASEEELVASLRPGRDGLILEHADHVLVAAHQLDDDVLVGRSGQQWQGDVQQTTRVEPDRARSAGREQHHADRLTHPLKKDGQGFETISWDQAIDEISQKLRAFELTESI